MSEFVVSLVDKVTAPAKTMASATTSLTGAVTSLSGAFAKAADPAAAFQGALGGLADRFGSLGAMLNPTTLAIAAVTTVVTGAVAAVGWLASKLVDLTTATVQFTQGKAQTLATFDALTDGAGKQTLEAIGKLSAALPYSGGQIKDWAKELAKAGITGPQLSRGVLAAASASAILGDTTGEAAGNVTALLSKLSGFDAIGQNVKLDRRLLKELRGVGVGVDDLAAELGKPAKELGALGVSGAKMAEALQNILVRKGKPALEGLSLTWESISTKVREGLRSMIPNLGPEVKALMVEVRSLFSEFFKGSTLTKLGGSALTAVMRVVLDIATRATRAIHIGFLDAQIAIFQAAVAVAPTVKWLRRLWDEHDGAGKLQTALLGIGAAVAFIGTILVLPIAIFGALAAVGVAAIGVVANVIAGLGEAAEAIAQWGEMAHDAASDFVGGLVRGITDGVSSVLGAVTNLADAAVGALKDALQIKSPSKLTARVGVDVAAGMAQGIDSGSGLAEDASREMAGRVAASSEAGRPGGRAGAGRGDITIRVEKVEVHAGSMAEALEVTEDKIASLLERAALRAGLVEVTA